jgi:hypothetical protein
MHPSTTPFSRAVVPPQALFTHEPSASAMSDDESTSPVTSSFTSSSGSSARSTGSSSRVARVVSRLLTSRYLGGRTRRGCGRKANGLVVALNDKDGSTGPSECALQQCTRHIGVTELSPSATASEPGERSPLQSLDVISWLRRAVFLRLPVSLDGR